MSMITNSFLLVQTRRSSKQRWRSSPPSSCRSARRRSRSCWRRWKPTWRTTRRLWWGRFTRPLSADTTRGRMEGVGGGSVNRAKHALMNEQKWITEWTNNVFFFFFILFNFAIIPPLLSSFLSSFPHSSLFSPSSPFIFFFFSSYNRSWAQSQKHWENWSENQWSVLFLHYLNTVLNCYLYES